MNDPFLDRPAIIYLGQASPPGSCSPPEVIVLANQHIETSSPWPLLGLAPGGGCLAIGITANAGGLLHWQTQSACSGEHQVFTHLFTLTCSRLEQEDLLRLLLWRIVSVARSGRLPRPGNYPAPCSLECGLSSERINHPAIARQAWGIKIILSKWEKV